eukprot:CAMPEP_0206241256 /NCGR_PEP_ID=MMETSP0047_2-20121206/16396_1 /ASSEMBLY_ACC=CAM_ASM_000192 /TAXON_ID=195065 /ORGANISM="Chroomonas mesostigmatica_cf, Strain CCMP1168" /LENGTH=153 /DNA_ID=CAMNT_0053666135 /DNA_START=20 /DNA_END=481 /DNA_ORIENTATION=+
MRALILLACVASASAFSVPALFSGLASKKAAISSFVSARQPLAAPAPIAERSGALEALQMSCTKDTRGFQMPMRKQCMLLGKRANNAMAVSFSHRRSHKTQNVNLQWKRVFWTEGNSFVRLRLSTKAIKTLKNKSLTELASKASLDLSKHRCG